MEKYDAKFSTKWDFSFMESICIGKNLEGNISDINSDFLRKWELNYGWILLTLYIFCSSQVFHKDHLYIETKQKKNHEKRIQYVAQNSFVDTLHILQ